MHYIHKGSLSNLNNSTINQLRQSNVIISKAIFHAFTTLFIFHGRKKIQVEETPRHQRILAGQVSLHGHQDNRRSAFCRESRRGALMNILWTHRKLPPRVLRLDPLPDNKGMSLKNGPSFLIQPLDRANPLAARDIFTLSRVTASKRGGRGGLNALTQATKRRFVRYINVKFNAPRFLLDNILRDNLFVPWP